MLILAIQIAALILLSGIVIFDEGTVAARPYLAALMVCMGLLGVIREIHEPK